MSELSRKLKQCRKPLSNTGKVIVEEMNESHYELTGWGLEKVAVSEDSCILDIGCGGGKTVARLAGMAEKGKIFGVDHSPDCVNWANEYNRHLVNEGRVEISHAGAESLPFEDGRFDVVVAVETVYFWPRIAECFREVKRVLKPKGQFVIINEMYVSEAFRERNEQCAATGEMTIYTPRQLELLLEETGFAAVSTDLVEEKNWLCCVGKRPGGKEN